MWKSSESIFSESTCARSGVRFFSARIVRIRANVFGQIIRTSHGEEEQKNAKKLIMNRLRTFVIFLDFFFLFLTKKWKRIISDNGVLFSVKLVNNR